MEKSKASSYRWIVLLSMIPVLAMTNVFWLTFAPIAGMTEAFYNVSSLQVSLLSMSYMIVYILLALPASWLVDTKGFRLSMGIGAVATALFGLLRGVFAANFTIVIIAQFGIAIGQPFLINAITKVAARWFPVNERATAAGIATMAGYLGMIVAMVCTPLLTEKYGLEKMLLLYGYAAIVSALIFILLSRERSESPSANEEPTELSMKNAASLLQKRNFICLTLCVAIVMGIFNAVMTWIENLLRVRGISAAQSGLIGGLLVVVGLVGAVLLPLISDKIRKRRPLLIWPVAAALLGFIGLAFSSDYSVLLLSSALMGFFIMGMGPIAFQYGAEIAYPVPEGTSFGVLMLSGQVSGILFIFVMDAMQNIVLGGLPLSLILLILIMLASFFIALRLKESHFIDSSNEKEVFHPSDGGIEPAKETVCKAGTRLLRSGLVSGTWGNISIRLDDTHMVVTPSGKAYESLTPDDMVVVNLYDLSYEGNIKPSGESGLHAAIYKQRKEINAVIHTHSSNACTVAAARREVPPILDDMAQIIGPSVRVAEYAIPGTAKLIKGTMKALEGRNAALLANHGAICIGRTLEEAFVTCEILEKACRTFIESEFLGGAVSISPVEAWVMHQYYIKKYSKSQ